MRIVAELPRPEFKIIIFSINNKFLIKCERGVLEQTYKLSEADMTDGVNSVFKILDERFIATIAKRFDEMKSDFKDAYQRQES